MPKVSDEYRQARREEILAAAERAFAAKGYQRTSISDVLAESGLSTGAVYAHFTGKQDLFVAVARDTLLRRTAALEREAAGGPPPSPGQMLRILLESLLREGGDPQLLVQLWSEATIEPSIRAAVNELVQVARTAFDARLRRWFAEHPEHAPDGTDVAVRDVVPVMLALAQGFLIQHAILDDFDPDAYLDAVAAVLPG
ncbi:TetR/AcrR family transcriptional regulator [Myceligenerans crystallogenes]|uniref:HTH tetR-type domain-containing protein n=1 Tax=Myceligenerans crystallogenes TaxID=316335 RepID=A0ABN2NK66_9MICO